MQNWEEVIFEDRNKLYGSYLLRKKYYKYLIIGFLTAIALFLLPLYVLFYHYQKQALMDDMPITISVELSHPIDVDNLISEPPAPIKIPNIGSDEKVPLVTDSVTEPKKPEKKDQSSIKDSTLKDEKEKEKTADGNDLNAENDTSSYLYVDELPEPFGGKEELSKFIRKNIVVPEAFTKKRIKGIIVIQFVVAKTGDVREVKLLSGIDSSIDNEAMRVISILPKWKPAKRAGRAIAFKYKIPINFY